MARSCPSNWDKVCGHGRLGHLHHGGHHGLRDCTEIMHWGVFKLSHSLPQVSGLARTASCQMIWIAKCDANRK